MNPSNAQKKLLTIVPKLNDWQTLFLLKFAEVFEWITVSKKHLKLSSTQSNFPTLRITPIVPGSGFTDTCLCHDTVLAENEEE